MKMFENAVLSVPHGINYLTCFVELQNFEPHADINSVAFRFNQPVRNRIKVVATNATDRFFLDQAVQANPGPDCVFHVGREISKKAIHLVIFISHKFLYQL